MLTLILKGTNGCNLNCSYCSLGEKPRYDTVTEKMLCSIFEFVCRVCEFRHESQLEIILHGGEPTIVPVKVYESAIQYIQNRFPKLKIRLSMQTNAFHISEEYLDFLLRYQVNVGVSIDGSSEIHDKVRKSRSGRDTFGPVTENINRMIFAGLNVSGLMVLSSIGVEVTLDYLNYFASRHIHLKINPLLNYGEAYKNPELAIRTGDYAHFLIRVYEYIVANSVDITISPVDKIIQAILRRERIRECTFNSECNNRFICIDHTGDVYPCGKYSDIHSFKLGNVLSLERDFLHSPQMNMLRDRRSCNLPDKCRKCKYVILCNAGCNAEASIENKFGEPPFLCDDYQMLFDYFSGTGLRLLRKQLLDRREQLMEKNSGV